MMKNLIAITCFIVALVSCNKVENRRGEWGGPDGGYGLV